MQSLSSMLSPLKSSPSSSVSTDQQGNMNFQTPLSITIPPNDYEMAGIRQFANDPCQGDQSNSMWPITYNQQPLLASKDPSMDALATLNAGLGNQYTYQMFDAEQAGHSQQQNVFQNDPRIGYDKIVYASANVLPYKDLYYQCAYGEPKTERMAIRHKLDDDDAGPEAKRQCVGEPPRFGNERSVIVQNTSVIGSSSNTHET
ncbi:hypothetical protein GCK72_024348 [Caenorhabditis remanei]|uniref:Uncharacterized protein n=2 Tax=Caenorhabditis remanei TaxID=31234 RepID=E3LE84_CAERE|nr:hypothetical protein GCK72_024348 [Caenorhabditis remanei]EFO82513.1 hypothetical protein CRE_00772 [Caenorhabditis remanei]KAF1747882.1 hypothetical protein GCK72_024348 [Caenorhabditis remanei]